MITLAQDIFGRNVVYNPDTGEYLVFIDPDNAEVGIRVHLDDRDDDRAYYIINSMAPG